MSAREVTALQSHLVGIIVVGPATSSALLRSRSVGALSRFFEGECWSFTVSSQAPPLGPFKMGRASAGSG